MSIFNFWRKRSVATVPPDVVMDTIVEMGRLYGFSCKHCGAGMYDDRTDCLVCKTPYSSRLLGVALLHRETKQKLLKKMPHDDTARILKDVTMDIARNPKLPVKETLDALLAYYDT